MSIFKSPTPTIQDQTQSLITAQKNLQTKRCLHKTTQRNWYRVWTVSLLKWMPDLSLTALGGHLYRTSRLAALSTVGYYRTLLGEMRMMKKHEMQERKKNVSYVGSRHM